MGQTRRFRTLTEVGPADRFDTIADLRRDRHIIRDMLLAAISNAA
jgi:hypothetical protein